MQRSGIEHISRLKFVAVLQFHLELRWDVNYSTSVAVISQLVPRNVNT